MLITSRDLNVFEGDLDMVEININDQLHYWHGDSADVSLSRSGFKPVSARVVFANAVKARELADRLIRAADEMDLRIAKALSQGDHS